MYFVAVFGKFIFFDESFINSYYGNIGWNFGYMYTEMVLLNFWRSPGIISWGIDSASLYPGGPVRQPYSFSVPALSCSSNAHLLLKGDPMDFSLLFVFKTNKFGRREEVIPPTF